MTATQIHGVLRRRRLVDAGLIQVRPRGRHRYYVLSGPLVAAALEAIALVAPPVPVRSLRQSRAASALIEARSCYDHLAGQAGVAVRTALLEAGALAPDGLHDHRLTEQGYGLLAELGVEIDSFQHSRRVFARDCLDWTERRPHLAGALPAALLNHFVRMRWLVTVTITLPRTSHTSCPS